MDDSNKDTWDSSANGSLYLPDHQDWLVPRSTLVNDSIVNNDIVAVGSVDLDYEDYECWQDDFLIKLRGLK